MRFARGSGAGLRAELESRIFADVQGDDIGALVERIGRQGLAEQIAGTTDKKSKAYRNARDNISRWLRGARRPSAPATLQRLNRAARVQHVQQRSQQGPMRVTINADVTVSKKKWNRGNMVTELDGAALLDFLEAAESGNNQAAMTAFLDQYGLDPDMVASIDSIHSIDIE